MENLFDLTGKIALVTGSTSGIGKAIAEILGKYGATVLVSSNDKQACVQTGAEFHKKGIKVLAIECDVSRKLEIDTLLNTINQYVGSLDIFVNTVGIAQSGSFLDINDEIFEKTMQINLESAIYFSQKIIPDMQVKKDGAIIFLSSLSSIRGNKYLGLYGISKAGLVQLARNLAVEFGPFNIRVNAISPGVIDTDFAKPMTSNPEIMEKRILATPLRRIGKVEDIAGVVLMLATKAGAFISGQNIIIDGGTSISDGN